MTPGATPTTASIGGQRPIEYGYFHTRGRRAVTVPAGHAGGGGLPGAGVSRVISRGHDAHGDSTSFRPSGTRAAGRSAGAGWYSGDLHVHMNYGGTYRNDSGAAGGAGPRRGRAPGRESDREQGRTDPRHRLLHRRAGSGLDRQHADRPRSGVPHQLLGTHRAAGSHVATSSLPGYCGLRQHRGREPRSRPTPPCLDLAHEQGGVTGYVHPFDSSSRSGDTTRPLTHELPVDVALGKVDYYEALGFVDDYTATARVWYQLLNCGFRLPGRGGHRCHGELRVAPWSGRHEPGVREERAAGSPALAGRAQGRADLRHQRTAAGLYSERPGDRRRAWRCPADKHELVARITSSLDTCRWTSWRSYATARWWPSVPLTGRSHPALHQGPDCPAGGAGGISCAPGATAPRIPVLDVYPYATTSPDLRDRRRRADSLGGRMPTYFLAWIDRLERRRVATQGLEHRTGEGRALDDHPHGPGGVRGAGRPMKWPCLAVAGHRRRQRHRRRSRSLGRSWSW